MSLSIGTVVVVLLVVVVLSALGRKAYRQNRPLFETLRQGKRSLGSMLWQALLVWSPMLLVIALLLGIAAALSLGTTELAYRYTTLDEFCEVKGAGSPMVIACTGMGNELPVEKIRPVDPRADIERQLFRRYRDARKALLLTSMQELDQQTKNPSEFGERFSPAAMLGLSPIVDDDPLLLLLVTQKRRVVQSPIPNPSDIAEVLSYRQSVDTRNRILQDLELKIEARKKVLYAVEYGRLTPKQVADHNRKKRIVLLLRAVDVSVDPLIQTRRLSPVSENAESADFFRKALVRSLAHSERAVRDIVLREIETAEKAAAAYDALGFTPECTVVSRNPAVRLSSQDFEAEFADPDTFVTNNAGSFPCIAKRDQTNVLPLKSVGFRKSVLLSLDRLYEDAAFNAFKKLDVLERQARAGISDAESARAVFTVVPATIHLGRQDCGLWHPLNCVMNGFADTAETIYSRSLDELKTQGADLAEEPLDAASKSMQQSIDNARVTADADVKLQHDAAYKAAESLFRFNDVLGVLGWIALVLIVLRSFLYVFALELFHRNGEFRISFDVENPVEGAVVSGPEITIDRDFPLPLINRGSLTNTLADIQFAPWRWSAPIARILQGRYFLFNRSVFSPPNQAAVAEQVKGMEASARSGYSIVEWRMQPGEEVIFHYRDFYGASANVQLMTDFSLRLSTLLLGKTFFHYARCVGGEGRLLLEARVHNTTQAGMSSFKPSRLVAWNRHAQFTADSHRHPWKTFINPYTIVRESATGLLKGLVVIAPESESTHFFGMGIRSLKRIFSRIF